MINAQTAADIIIAMITIVIVMIKQRIRVSRQYAFPK